MDPIIDNDWLGSKNEPNEDSQNIGNVARSWQWRERGINPPNYPSNKSVLENVAEDILVKKSLKIRWCDLPGYPRSTFLMVFSPDGTKVASTHGNHNVYVSEMASGKHVKILKGHPRTPWCIAFHPSHAQLIASGCLGGQVRVWALSGGSEVWTVGKETVVASIAFHPRDQLLVIATFNELYFWDWSQPAPFTKVSTNNINEKVRYVAFDSLGFKLITGVTVWSGQGGGNPVLQATTFGGPATPYASDTAREGNRTNDGTGSTQEMIVTSYHNLVQRYDSLVRNYRRLFMARHHLANPNSTNTTDRGTDPMETDFSASPRTSNAEPSTSQTASRPSRNTDNDESGRRRRAESSDGENSSSRLLNLDVLSFDSNTNTRSQETTQTNPTTSQRSPIIGSRRSAFQAFGENSERRNLFASGDRSQRVTPRVLPNPFSSTTNSTNLPQRAGTTQRNTDNNAGHRAANFRPNIFVSQGQDVPTPTRYFIQRRGPITVSQMPQMTAPENATNTPTPPAESTSFSVPPPAHSASRPFTTDSFTSARTHFAPVLTSHRPQTTNSSTQISPETNQTINESLDLIRDILRDSGTRLLNLITNMSLSTLASVERSIPRRTSSAHSQSDEGERANRTRSRQSRIRLFSSRFRSEFLSSGSESDNDPSLEVNIYRTRNSSYSERNTENSSGQATTQPQRPTDRLVVDLNVEDGDRNNENGESSQPNVSTNRINIRVSSNRFRVRTQNEAQNASNEDNNATPPQGAQRDAPSASTAQTAQETPLDLHTSRPSTSTDDSWMYRTRPNVNISSQEAYRRVKLGMNALQKHTGTLTHMWLHGTRTSMQDLRKMWENLRRRVLSLYRQAGRHDTPSYYTRSILERCRILTEMSRNLTESNLVNTTRFTNSSEEGSRSSRSGTESNPRNGNRRPQNGQRGPPDASVPSTSTSVPSDSLNSQALSPTVSSRSSRSNGTSSRRRMQPSFRCRSNNESRRRSRNTSASRWNQRPGRRETSRSAELHCTRNDIRVRAMQVLSIMFNMMMNCLEEQGLSQLIIFMLRTLKKALGLTCLLLMTNRLNRADDNRSSSRTREAAGRDQDAQNQSEQASTQSGGATQNNISSNANAENNRSNSTSPCPSSETDDENPYRNEPLPSRLRNIKFNMSNPFNGNINDESLVPTASQTWSNRLAVQIAAANRNYSATARNRQNLYLESKRQKALHRCNPNAHPIMKKRVLPPATMSRIPNLRTVQARDRPLNAPTTPTDQPPPLVPLRHAVPPLPPLVPIRPIDNLSPEIASERGLDSASVLDRINLFRMAQLHAVRLRNAARNRIRRLQTIQLYTSSSVREMFGWQSQASGGPPENQASGTSPADTPNLRPFAAYRHRLTTPRPDEYDFFLLNEHPPGTEPRTGANNPPRPHEYLQPIILAQNALVVSGEELAASGAVAHEATIVAESLGTPTHRVQAWDFTSGRPPAIHDNTKNVVVQRCKIHNDASVDISKDGKLLVALLPVPRLRNVNHRLGVYSLEWGRLGQLLYTASLEQSAVSVALSPTARYLAVGLGSRRFATMPHARNNVFSALYRLSPSVSSSSDNTTSEHNYDRTSHAESSSRTGLLPIRELEQNWEHGFTSLNCLRWAPQPGQGLVYANNTGQLVIMS